jgi:hypothetical protein
VGKFFKNLAKGAERVELGTPRQQTSVPNLAVLPFPKTARFSGNLAHETTLASETVPSWHSGPESTPKPTPFLRRGPESGICISIPIPGHFGVGIGVGNRTVLTLLAGTRGACISDEFRSYRGGLLPAGSGRALHQRAWRDSDYRHEASSGPR